MKRTAFVSILFALLLAISAAVFAAPAKKQAPPAKQKPASYSVFKITGSNFSVEIPSKLKEMKPASHEIDTELGKQTINIYFIESDDIVFMASYINFQNTGGITPNNEKLLDSSVEGLVGEGEVISDKKISVENLPARRMRIKKVSEGQTVYDDVLILISGMTQYMLQALAYDAKRLDKEDSLHFIASFKFTGPAPAAAEVKTGFVKFASAEGDFSVEIPARFQTMKENSDTDHSGITTRMYLLEDAKMALIVSATKYNEPVFSDSNMMEGLRAAAEGGAEGGEIISREDSEIAGHKAARIRFSKDVDGTKVYDDFSVFFIGSTMFQLQGLTYEETNLDSDEIQHFLKSFVFLGSE